MEKCLPVRSGQSTLSTLLAVRHGMAWRYGAVRLDLSRVASIAFSERTHWLLGHRVFGVKWREQRKASFYVDLCGIFDPFPENSSNPFVHGQTSFTRIMFVHHVKQIRQSCRRLLFIHVLQQPQMSRIEIFLLKLSV